MLKIILIVLLSIGLLALAVVGLCIHIAKKALHPTAKRKPLDVWPDQYNLPYENIYFKTEDGILIKGWFLPNPDSDKTIVLMHGWGMNWADIFKNTYFLRDLG